MNSLTTQLETEMTKDQFIVMFKAMYNVGNRSDSDIETREGWTKPAMAGSACCQLLDQMSRKMVECGALTEEERDAIYNDL